MTAQQLRNSILQQAIQGRLVPQNPQDEPIALVFSDVETQRKSLCAEGKISKKEISIRQVLDVPYELPTGWLWSYISDVTFFQEGPGILAVDFCPTGVPLIRIAGMQSSEVRTTGCNYLDPDKVATKWKHFKLDKGDIVISSSASMDKIAEVGDEAEGCIPYTGLIRFKTLKCLYKPFFVYFIKSPFYQQQILEQEAGGTIKHYGPTHLKKMFIPLPPLEEQKRIVAKIEELMPLVEKYGKAQSELNNLNASLPSRLRQSILQEAIQGKLVEQDPNDEPASVLLEKIRKQKEQLVKEGKLKKKDLVIEPIVEDEIPFDIPENWKWVKLQNISYGVGTKFNQILSSEIIKEGSTAVVSQGISLIDGYTNVACKRIDDLPLVMFGDHTRNVKYIDFPFVIGADGTKFHKIIIANPKYIYYWMKRAAAQMRNRGYARHYSLLKELPIPLPPLAEQRRIVAKVESLFAAIDKLK